MSTLQPVSQTEKLSELQPGDEFEVVEVLLGAGSLRRDRFSPGRRWLCLYKGAAVMLLVGRSRETISIPLKATQCVEVRRTASQGSRATAGQPLSEAPPHPSSSQTGR
jgi:hypothetical protein